MDIRDSKGNIDEGKLTKAAFKVVGGIIVAIIILIAIFGSWYTIVPGERGVLLTLGKPDAQPTTEGLHFKIPFVQKVIKMDIQTQKYDAKASAASSDLQVVSTDIAVNYHLASDSVVRIYTELGFDYGTRVIQPAVQETVKAATAHYTAEELITKRNLVKDEIDKSLSDRLLPRGIIMETTSITNFDFSEQFNQAIEQKVTAEQNALTQKNKLAQVQYEAQQVVATADGQRDAAIAAAEAEAKQKILVAESEAKALELQKTQITPELLQLRAIEVQSKLADKWNGQLPMYNLGSNSLPLLNIPMTQIAAAASTVTTQPASS